MATNVPIGSGGLAIIGVRHTSKPMKKRATRRLKRWTSAMADSHCDAVTLLAGLPQRPVQRFELAVGGSRPIRRLQ